MFAVLFEVHPHTEQWDAYLDYAKMLRPELEAIDGFVDNIRYRSLTRPGWILSLSSWRDEKALVRWRTRARHHDVQAKGREEEGEQGWDHEAEGGERELLAIEPCQRDSQERQLAGRRTDPE